MSEDLDTLLDRAKRITSPDYYFIRDLADALSALRKKLVAVEGERDDLRAAIFGGDDYKTELHNSSFVGMAKATETARVVAVTRVEEAEDRTLAAAAKLAAVEGALGTAYRAYESEKEMADYHRELASRISSEKLREIKRATAAEAREAELTKALERIERWFGEFPETGEFWDEEKTRPMSYATCYGSNGERDYMRAIARAALTKEPGQ